MTMNMEKRYTEITVVSTPAGSYLILDLEEYPGCGELILMKRGIAHDRSKREA